MSFSPSEAWNNCQKLASKHLSKMLKQHEDRAKLQAECRQAARKAELEAEPEKPKEPRPAEILKEKIIELRKQGLKAREVAELTNVSPGYVRNILSLADMKCSNYVRATPELKRTAIKLLQNGASDYDVVIALNVKLPSVQNWRRNICGIVHQRGRPIDTRKEVDEKETA